MENETINLLVKLTSSDNAVRNGAEQQLNEAVASDPSQFSRVLTSIASTTSVDLPIRQACLLHIKRIVPKHWSPAFDSYAGATLISQDVKQYIRDASMKLLGDPDSKIRNGAAYAIVQISVVDYPDEWPNLLNDLYNQSTSSQDGSIYGILGSLSVLHDLFDDLVADEQFFEGGVGINVMQTCEYMLTNSQDLRVKTATILLLKVCFEKLENTDTYEFPQRKLFIESTIPKAIDLLWNLAKSLTESTSEYTSLTALTLKSEIYESLYLIANSFSHIFKAFKITNPLIQLLLVDMKNLEGIYVPLIFREDDNIYTSIFPDFTDFQEHQIERKEPLDVVIKTISSQISLLQVLTEMHHLSKLAPEIVSQLVNNLIVLSYLPSEAQDLWINDFNEFVTVESGLSIESTVRESIFELLSEINEKDCDILIEALVPLLSNSIQHNEKWVNTEAITFLLYICYTNESEGKRPSFQLTEFLNFILSYITSKLSSLESLEQEEEQLLISRFILLVPKFLQKYSALLDPKSFGVAALKQMSDATTNSIPRGSTEFNVIRSALLISFTYFNQFIRSASFDSQIQYQMIEICLELAKEAEEDANISILDAIVILINIDNKALTSGGATNCLELIFTIAFKDSSSFAINNSVRESLEDLLNELPSENYLTQCEKGLPVLFGILDPSLSGDSVEYSSDIDLSLQILSVFIQGTNEDSPLPLNIFEATFPRISKLILLTDDDQLLQSSSEVFNDILKKSSDYITNYKDPQNNNESGNETILKAVSKFLSPSLSDSAIVNLGDIVVSLIRNFQRDQAISQYLEDILRAVTLRLASAKHVLTIENLILIFNELAFASPSSTIEFLQNFAVPMEDGSQQMALNVIIPIWLNAFEVMRGYEKILSNIKAFTEIFKLDSPVLRSLLVNGDQLPLQLENPEVIITRSMAKKIPIRYEQIPAPLKIVKLLIHELNFQFQQADAADVIDKTLNLDGSSNNNNEDGDEDGDDDDDGWEELEDIGVPSFDKLKSYVSGGGDDDDLEAEDREDEGDRGTGEESKELLKSFFKECAVKNLGNFQQIYEWLNDEEKKTLTEYVVFT